MNLFSKILILMLPFTLAGCLSRINIPEISAESIEYRRTDPFGGSTIIITKPSVTETDVTCEEYSRVTTYPSFNQSITVKNYHRKRAKQDSKNDTPPN